MAFSYTDRNKYQAEWKEEWSKKNEKLYASMTEEEQKIVQELQNPIYYVTRYNYGYLKKEALDAFWRANDLNSYPSMSAFLKKKMDKIVRLFVPKQYVEEYYGIVDRFPSFAYTIGHCRRSLRSHNLNIHFARALELMRNYRTFGYLGCTMEQYLRNDLSEMALDAKNNSNYGECVFSLMGEIIAASINAGDQKTKEAIREAILSENNTVIVDVNMIRGILMSDDKELWELLGSFLLAARLQEGVRQAVCENADMGCPEAFMTILDVIEKNNMIRFAAVKRAIATWIGIFDPENTERITEKLLTCMSEGVRDRKKALEMTETNDSIQIMCGLWAIGFYDDAEAAKKILDISAHATRNQLLTMSYYNQAIQDKKLAHKVAKETMLAYGEDPEMAAAYMPTYLEGLENAVKECILFDGKREYSWKEGTTPEYKKADCNLFFEGEEEARVHYEWMKKMLFGMKKGIVEFAPSIFPWYSTQLLRSDLATRCAAIAYILQDEKIIDEVCDMIPSIGGNYGIGGRPGFLMLLLHDPKNEKQKQTLLKALADKDSTTRQYATFILQKKELSGEDLRTIAGFMKFKTAEIRTNVITLLQKHSKEELTECVSGLLTSKDENCRLGALDLIKIRCEKHEDEKEYWKSFAIKIVKENGIEWNGTEKNLYDEIVGGSSTALVNAESGYGIYDPTAFYEPRSFQSNPKIVSEYYNLTEKELNEYFSKIKAFVHAHGTLEYKPRYGEETVLLGNRFCAISYGGSFSENYPFPELWKELYETVLKSEKVVNNLIRALHFASSSVCPDNRELYRKYEKVLFPNYGVGFRVEAGAIYDWDQYRFAEAYKTILFIIKELFNLSVPAPVEDEIFNYALSLPEEGRWYAISKKDYAQRTLTGKCSFVKIGNYYEFGMNIHSFEDKDRAQECFDRFVSLNRCYQFKKNTKDQNRMVGNEFDALSLFEYIKLCQMDIISKDIVYRYIYEETDLPESFRQLCVAEKNKYSNLWANTFKKFMELSGEENTPNPNDPFHIIAKELHDTILKEILNAELHRGDSETFYSPCVRVVDYVEGSDNLIGILTALGKDTLDRSTYYCYSGVKTKKETLSHLLSVCHPSADDNAADLGKKIKKSKITEDRLIEVAMYSPQWLELIEKILGYKGLTSGCYYFMAHMNESFDDKKKAIIAKYTPLTADELNDGCFDVEWFRESYETLGSKVFSKLYKSAKYISDGNKHSRARKYADAALGEVERDELEKVISDKRNKDLLMSYGLIPLADEADALHRYEFIQKYKKEAKQFGAQRRASETKAADVALKNMASACGYGDELRLILAMETALVSTKAHFFDGMIIDEYEVKVVISGQGKAETVISKDGKKLKTIPAALKKNEDFQEVKEFESKLRNQYSRCVSMFENSMEEREYYSFKELKTLMVNPVIGSIITNLVWANKKNEFLVPDEPTNGNEADLWCVAHPVDLFDAGVLADYQRLFFERTKEKETKQPFKQVFREFYRKLPEEMDFSMTRMFAGYQIQPKKTVATLRTRRWVADYEDGLQKVYYKDNIIATLYAMADWFSPADTECPTLEYVAFYDRKTFEQKKISEIPDIVYSEVMRDTDLAVSVAYAGGVDPETSHSTIEMRKVIVAFNLELFGLKNVTMEGTHAYIKGTLANYTVHLGSGVIHKEGGAMLNILPVHSQHRGKIFLPFIDDDPKTAEIMSKILLLAEDKKIKDPYIMEQLH